MFAAALHASVGRAFGAEPPAAREMARYLESLHLADMALACACAEGNDTAWEHFMREQRPGLYRAADAIDAGGRARDLADSLYADLYGLGDRDGRRQSLFRYFNGRSSLATWLRAVLAQRHVDRIRAERRTEPLPDEDVRGPAAPHRSSRTSKGPVGWRLSRKHSGTSSRDSIRAIGCGSAATMPRSCTLAEIGRLLREHEATVSRHLTRVRRAIRIDLERELREAGLGEPEIAECFASVMRDPGPIDIQSLLGSGEHRKESGRDCSVGKEPA